MTAVAIGTGSGFGYSFISFTSVFSSYFLSCLVFAIFYFLGLISFPL